MLRVEMYLHYSIIMYAVETALLNNSGINLGDYAEE
jgi:hypothetical protein